MWRAGQSARMECRCRSTSEPSRKDDDVGWAPRQSSHSSAAARGRGFRWPVFTAASVAGAGRRISVRREHRDNVLKQLPHDVRIVMCEVSEVPERNLEAADLGLSGDRRRPLALGDQGELPEMVARAETCRLAAADGDRRLSVRDDEEADAAHLALLDQGGADRDGAFAKELRELSPLAVAEAAE